MPCEASVEQKPSGSGVLQHFAVELFEGASLAATKAERFLQFVADQGVESNHRFKLRPKIEDDLLRAIFTLGGEAKLLQLAPVVRGGEPVAGKANRIA